jgi:hypothetical protein
MCKLKTLLVLAATALLASAAQAQAEGYFEFGRIPGLGGEPTVQIDLSAAMLALVSAATRAKDPAAADAMAGIEGVRVHVYETVDDPQAVLDFIDDTSGTLEKKGWERTVFVQEPGEKVRIYTKLDKAQITGLTLMVFDGEAVFINVAGQINPAQLGQLMNAFGMDGVMDNLAGAGSTGAAP